MSKDRTEPHRAAVDRNGYVRRLIYDWCRVNRPDVVDIAKDEAAKKFPYKRARGRLNVELPNSMRELK